MFLSMGSFLSTTTQQLMSHATKRAAQDAFEQAVRDTYVTLAKEPSWPLAQCAEYLEELSLLFQTDQSKIGSWALTLRNMLGNDCPEKVREALDGLANAAAVVEAVELA